MEPVNFFGKWNGLLESVGLDNKRWILDTGSICGCVLITRL